MSSTRRVNRFRNASRIATAEPQPATPTNPFDLTQTKFDRLAEVNRELNRMRTLLKEREDLTRELMGLFINQTPTGFDVKQEISLATSQGVKIHRLTPNFYDQAKHQFRPTSWKSTAQETATIE